MKDFMQSHMLKLGKKIHSSQSQAGLLTAYLGHLTLTLEEFVNLRLDSSEWILDRFDELR
jgi:hypothetical protein